MSNRIDLAGKKFNRLTVIKPMRSDNSGHMMWLCRCDCGSETTVCSRELRNGKTKSCGCLRKQIASELFTGARNPGWNGGRRRNSEGYIRVQAKNHPKATKDGYVLEHILVAEQALGEYLPKGSEIHHINGIKDDNRLENLWWFPSHSEHMAFHNLQRKRSDFGRCAFNQPSAIKKTVEGTVISR